MTRSVEREGRRALFRLVLAGAVHIAPAYVQAQRIPNDGGKQPRQELVIAATTDVHGRIRAWDYYANAADPTHSLASAATIVDSLRRAHPQQLLLVDAGDLLQGNPLTYVAAKVSHPVVHPVIAAMNVMRYDAAVVGNHEFNYGVPALKTAIAQAAFPFLAANVHVTSGPSFSVPFTVVQRGAVKIGIVGATTPGAMVWDRDNLREAHVTITDIVPAVRQAVADARARGADVIVVLLHSGLSESASYDTSATSTRSALPSENVAARVAREVNGIDLVVYGHSHKELVDSTINGALLIQPRNWAATVGVATLTMQRVDKRWCVVSHRGQAITTAGHAESPDVLSASTGSHRATIAWANAPSGRTAVAWHADSARVTDQPITDLVNEVMRRESGADLAATAVFSLDASLDSGSITRAQIARLYPYDNTLRAVRISGAQLRAFLEHASRYYRTLGPDGHAPTGGLIDPSVPGFNFDVLAGADYTIDLTKPVGARITRLLVNGRAVAPTDSFTLALNNYRQGGGGGYAMLAGAPIVYEKDIDIRQLVLDEVTRASAGGAVLDPARYAARNWRIEPDAAVSIAYEEQRALRASEAAGGPPRVVPPTKRPSADSTHPPTAAGSPRRPRSR